MKILEELSRWLEKRPLVLMRFSNEVHHALVESRRGLRHFTLAKRHAELSAVRVPTLCLAEMGRGHARQCYVGVISSKSAITTLDSRVTVTGLLDLNLSSFDEMIGFLGRPLKAQLQRKLSDRTPMVGLSPKLSVALVERLARDPQNKAAIQTAALRIPKLRNLTTHEWEQLDAIKTAVAAFGLQQGDRPFTMSLSTSSDSALRFVSTNAHVLEDNVIARDASEIPGFALIRKYVTGRAVFRRGDEWLDVYTANRGPLEEMLGVDLIYINHVAGNTVMLQYKMLEQKARGGARADWILRPDSQLTEQIARMRIPLIETEPTDYRLHRDPFFFKLVKRKGDGETHHSYVVSLDHLNKLLASQSSRGRNGAVRLTFDALDGIYLREWDLIGLIRSGYVGTHRSESTALRHIIDAVSRGDRALVVAWQHRIKSEALR